MSSGFPIPGLCRQCKLNPSRKFTTYVDRSNPDGMVQDSTVPVYAEVRRKISTIFIYIYICYRLLGYYDIVIRDVHICKFTLQIYSVVVQDGSSLS